MKHNIYTPAAGARTCKGRRRQRITYFANSTGKEVGSMLKWLRRILARLFGRKRKSDFESIFDELMKK